MNRSEMLKLMYKLNRIFTSLNKYFYILPILSIISSIKNSKIFIRINTILKVIILINIILGVSIVILFTDFGSSLNTTYSIYSDLLEPYIDLIKHLINQLLNTINQLGSIKPENELESLIKESNIQDQIKSGIKSGVKEALEEVLGEFREELNDLEQQSSSELLKQIALYSSVLFFGYFLFYLPGSSITLTELAEYHWFNQGLIEFKLSLINLFSNPTDPGNPPVDPVIPSSPNSPSPNTEFNNYFKEPISPTSSTDVEVTPTVKTLNLSSVARGGSSTAVK